MPFTPKNWQNAPSTATPIDELALEDVEIRLSGYTDSELATLRARSAINVKNYGAVGDGVTDDTDELLAAVAAADAAGGGIVFLPTGIFQFSDVIEIPQGVTLQGSGNGGWEGTDGSILRATAADAQIYFTGSKALHQGFRINGNTVATNPMKVGGVFAPTFIGITVDRAAEDNCILYDTQQPTMYSCDFGHPGRDGLVLDGSTQSGLFSRMDVGGNIGRHGLRIGPAGGVSGFGAYYHRFEMLMLEQQAGDTDDPLLKIDSYGGGNGLIIFDQIQVNGAAGAAAATIEINEAVDYTIDNIVFRDLQLTHAAPIGVLVDVKNDKAVEFYGRTKIGSSSAASSAIKVITAGTVALHDSLGVAASTTQFVDAASATKAVYIFGDSTFEYGAAEAQTWGDAGGIDESLVVGPSIFINAADGKLTFEDGDTGTTHALY